MHTARCREAKGKSQTPHFRWLPRGSTPVSLIHRSLPRARPNSNAHHPLPRGRGPCSNLTFRFAVEGQLSDPIAPPFAAEGQTQCQCTPARCRGTGALLEPHRFACHCRGGRANSSAHRPLPRGKGQISNSTFPLAAEGQHPSLTDPPLAAEGQAQLQCTPPPAEGQGPLFESHLSICRRGTALRSHCSTVRCRGADPMSVHTARCRGAGAFLQLLSAPPVRATSSEGSWPPAPRGAGPGSSRDPGREGRDPSSLSVCLCPPPPWANAGAKDHRRRPSTPARATPGDQITFSCGGCALEGFRDSIPIPPSGAPKPQIRGTALERIAKRRVLRCCRVDSACFVRPNHVK